MIRPRWHNHIPTRLTLLDCIPVDRPRIPYFSVLIGRQRAPLKAVVEALWIGLPGRLPLAPRQAASTPENLSDSRLWPHEAGD